MECKFCQKEMENFTESFICCFNEDCPHRKLKVEEREGAKCRGYCVPKMKGVNNK